MREDLRLLQEIVESFRLIFVLSQRWILYRYSSSSLTALTRRLWKTGSTTISIFFTGFFFFVVYSWSESSSFSSGGSSTPPSASSSSSASFFSSSSSFCRLITADRFVGEVPSDSTCSSFPLAVSISSVSLIVKGFRVKICLIWNWMNIFHSTKLTPVMCWSPLLFYPDIRKETKKKITIIELEKRQF